MMHGRGNLTTIPRPAVAAVVNTRKGTTPIIINEGQAAARRVGHATNIKSFSNRFALSSHSGVEIISNVFSNTKWFHKQNGGVVWAATKGFVSQKVS